MSKAKAIYHQTVISPQQNSENAFPCSNFWRLHCKKGQVTLFIIIGIIILTIIGGGYYYYSTIQPKIIPVQGEASVVQNYVSTCLQDIATQGVLLLGQQGGYTNLTRTGNFEIDEADATASDAVTLGTLQIPYWWYEDSTHGCTQCSITTKNMPSLESMTEDLNTYISEHIQDCLANFTALQDQGYTITAPGEPFLTTTVGDTTVIVDMDYSLNVLKEGATTELSRWETILDVPLKQIYNDAVEVTNMEIQNQFLEQITLNVISAYSGIDGNRLPPIAGFSEGYAVVYWIKANVKEQLGQYIKTYIPLIQIQGTTGAVQLQPETEYGSGFFSMLFRQSDYAFGNREVKFISPTAEYTDYYLDITPRSGELLKPNVYKNDFPVSFISPIQTNHYLFFYDVSYPVVVSVRDSTALQGEGYTFLFALESNLRDNKNLMEWAAGRGTYGPWDSSKVSIGLKEGVPTTYPSGFDTETNQTIYSTYEEPEKTLICDRNQRISGTISVTVYDGLSGNPIPSASISYKCGTYKTCSIGSTSYSGSYTDKFPVCIGGAIRIDAEGYYTSYVSLDALPDKEDTVMALLEPLVSIPVTIKYIPAARLNESLSTQALRNLAFDMGMTDSVLLTFEKVPEQLFESQYTQVVSITKDQEVNVTLVSGTYSITGMMMDSQGVIIPARNDTIEGEDIEYPEVNMTPAMLGQITLDETSGQWIVNAEDLHNAKGVTFYVFRINDPHYIEDLSVLGDLEDYSTLYRDVIEPEFE
ncbi:MAG: hypothetical protein WC254_01000 [Candidatus Woesearchaeota archaeon]|jgi:hypothetical protein